MIQLRRPDSWPIAVNAQLVESCTTWVDEAHETAYGTIIQLTTDRRVYVKDSVLWVALFAFMAMCAATEKG